MFSIFPGSKVLFDTNIFIYSALDHPDYGDCCTRLIYEVESGEIIGYVPNIVLNELLHRLMISEVINIGMAKNTGDAIKILKKDKSVILGLHICWEELDKMNEKPETFRESISISKRYSLLAKDAFIASFANSYEIENIDILLMENQSSPILLFLMTSS